MRRPAKSVLKKRERPPRRRRDAAAARAAILDAAEAELVSAGPGGIRLQEVAARAGVSHPTVLHHFGSREALVKAVTVRSLQALHARLVEAIVASSGEEGQLAAIIENAAAALSAGGQGRIMLWLALEGQRIDRAEARLAEVVKAAHALRQTRQKGRRVPPLEDTGYTVVLAALALLGASVIGPTLLENAGLESDAAALGRFRAWLTHVLLDHLDRC